MTHEVLVAGETLIDFLPNRTGPLTDVETFERRPGGAPANVAVALSRLAEPPLFWTRVGDDPFGRYLEDHLRDEGLSGRYLERDPTASTTLAFVTHDADGDRQFTFYRRETADTRLQPRTVESSALEDCRWVHAGGVTLAGGRSQRATKALLERAHAADCTVSFDPNFRPELWPDVETFRRVIRDALANVDVLKATVEELRTLGFDGDQPSAVAADALTAGPQTVFVTQGSAGATAVTSRSDEQTATHEGFDVDVVDTTGAGDAFVAGTIVALREGRGLAETLTFGSAVAAMATTEPGAMTALPNREAVDRLLDSDG